MSTFLKLNHNLFLKDVNLSRCLYKVTKQMTEGCNMVNLQSRLRNSFIISQWHYVYKFSEKLTCG